MHTLTAISALTVLYSAGESPVCCRYHATVPRGAVFGAAEAARTPCDERTFAVVQRDVEAAERRREFYRSGDRPSEVRLGRTIAKLRARGLTLRAARAAAKRLAASRTSSDSVARRAPGVVARAIIAKREDAANAARYGRPRSDIRSVYPFLCAGHLGPALGAPSIRY